MLATAAELATAARVARGGYAAANALRKRSYAEAILEGASLAEAWNTYKR